MMSLNMEIGRCMHTGCHDLMQASCGAPLVHLAAVRNLLFLEDMVEESLEQCFSISILLTFGVDKFCIMGMLYGLQFI